MPDWPSNCFSCSHSISSAYAAMVRVVLPARSSTHWIMLWKSFLNTLTHVWMSGSHWKSVATIDGTTSELPALDFLDLFYRDDLIARSYFGQQIIFRPAELFQQLIKARFFSIIESDVLFHLTARAKAKSLGTFFELCDRCCPE